MAKELPARLRIHKDVRSEIIAAAKDERRQPDVMLNVLLAWALEQREILGFDLSKLCKVHLSVSNVAPEQDLDEPWNHVVSGELIGEGIGFADEIWEGLGGR